MTEKSNQSLGKKEFNLPHVFDRSVIILLVIYAVVLLYLLFVKASSGYFLPYYYYEEYNNLSQITFIAGALISFFQFQFLQVKNKCITILSFGESRKSIFRKKFWFPLVFLLLITIGFYIILLCIDKKLRDGFSVRSDEYFANLFIALLPLVVGYTVFAFARIVSGKTSETVFFGLSICALPFALFNLIDAVFSLSLRGYYSVASDSYVLSNYVAPESGQPLPMILSLFDPLYTMNNKVSGFGSKDLSDGIWFETPAFYIIKNLIWICFFVALVFVIEKYFVEKYKVENCNKLGKSKAVRIICSLGPSLLATAILVLVLYQLPRSDVNNLQMLIMLILALVVGLIGTLVLTMVIYRRIKQLKYSLFGVGITSILSFLVAVIAVTGCFGYSTYTPDTDEIKSVMINDDIGLTPFYSFDYFYSNHEALDVGVSFKTSKEIELVKDVHKIVANDKACETTEQFTVIYELKNGNLIYRTYPYFSKSSCEKISTLWETETVRGFYKTILNQNPEINSTGTRKDWFEWMNGFIYNNNDRIAEDYDEYIEYYYDATSFDSIAKADSLVVFSKDNNPTYITDNQVSKEVMEKLKKALYEDYLSINAQQFYKPEKQLGVISLASCSELLEYKMQWWDEEDEEKPTSESVLEENGYYLYKLSITSDMVKTIKVLKAADLYKHFSEEKQIEKAHLVDSQKILSWYIEDGEGLLFSSKDEENNILSAITCYWDSSVFDDYLIYGCCYRNGLSYEETGYCGTDYYNNEHLYNPISKSDIEIITPEEAEKLRDKAFMTYNAGNKCKFLVMKYTDGTANMLVIPEE